jgi:hypothetical protein
MNSALMARLPQPVRLVLADVLGYDDAAPPTVPDELGVAAHAAAADGIAKVIDYQGPGYAQLYVQRLRRFSRRRGLSDSQMAEIARLLAIRMCVSDPPRIAELKLAGKGNDIADVIAFRLEDALGSLPMRPGQPLLKAAEALKWSRLRIKLHFSSRNALARLRLRMWVWLMRWRPTSLRLQREQRLVERWLHMIDRSLTLRPEALSAMIATARIIHGEGLAYHRRVGNWTMIMDRIAKPVLDGQMQLNDLRGALEQATALALSDPEPGELGQLIARVMGAEEKAND